MRNLFFCVAVLGFFSCSTIQQQQSAPSPVQGYCDKIYGNREGSLRAMKICLEQERNARKELSRLTIPVDVAEYCRKLSDSTGGSYSVMLTCVQKEM